MTGGTLQLTKYGAQNAYLNGNPQMTYFKTVYKRHTNFSMEILRLDFEGTQNIANDVETQLKCKITRNGDLINKIYFCINLPNIYSAHFFDNPEDQKGMNAEFAWIPNIGCQIIKKCTLSIGGNKISEVYGQWIEIYHEIFLDTSGKNNFDNMIGHQSDLFMPSHNGWNAGIYPSSSLNPSLNINPASSDIYFSKFKQNSFLQPPSINGRKLYVPIPFWFTTNPGLALPLIALQYHEITLEFECRPILELYTIIETKSNGTVPKGARTAPTTAQHHHIGNFITGIPSTNFSKNKNLDDGSLNIQGWNMDTHLLVNYIFLDNDERRKFSNNNHEYLIEQVYRQDFTGVIGMQTLKLQFQHPVKYLVWCGQRNDVARKLNRHNNYTNWEEEFIPPGTNAYTNLLGLDSENPLYYKFNNDGNLIYDSVSNDYKTLDGDEDGNTALLPTKFNFRFWQEDVIKSSRLLFDGVERYSSRDSIFFRYVQQYQHNIKTADKSGIYMYSFALDPSRYQPSGCCNMSRISNLQLELEMCDIMPSANNFDTYDFNVFVYAVNYNLLRVVGGMAGLAFSN
tara:strand:- start:1502 stop:3205 length:1704 start_codon:yes stop_codon:yes gene_type:complete